MKTTHKFIAISIILLLARMGYSQCTVQNPVFPVEQATFVSSVFFGPDGQTFLACGDGQIVSISIKMDATNTYNGTMNLWLLDGSVPMFADGAVYQVWDINDADVTGVQTIVLDTPFPVVSGNTYTFGVGNTSTTGNPIIDVGLATYPDGIMFFNNGQTIGTAGLGDINFSISIEPIPIDIPTMSQWGLIILGLSLLVFAIVGIRDYSLSSLS